MLSPFQFKASDSLSARQSKGGVAEWLCSGLQSRGRRFDSDPRLQHQAIKASRTPQVGWVIGYLSVASSQPNPCATSCSPYGAISSCLHDPSIANRIPPVGWVTRYPRVASSQRACLNLAPQAGDAPTPPPHRPTFPPAQTPAHCLGKSPRNCPTTFARTPPPDWQTRWMP